MKNGSSLYPPKDELGYDPENKIPYTKVNVLGGGHWGSFGMALNYYDSWRKTHNVNLIELTIPEGLDVGNYNILFGKGEGQEAKGEGKSILPSFGVGLFSLLSKKLSGVLDLEKVTVRSILSNNNILKTIKKK